MEILDYLFEKGKPAVDASDFPPETSFLQDYDAMVALLTYSSWKGEPRQVSVLQMGYTHPEWWCRLSDPQNRRSLTGSGKNLALALESLSASLVLGKEARWYYWPGGPTIAGAKSSTSSNGSATKKKSRGGSK